MPQNITIRIADVKPLSMSIPPESESLFRKAEHNVNNVWNAWRNKYSDHSSKEVLAMVTFRFAEKYYELLEQVNRQKVLLDQFEAELDDLLQISRPADGKEAD